MLREHRRRLPRGDKGAIWWKVLRRLARAFCLHTSQQGYRYLALPSHAPVERAFWAAVVAAAVAASAWIMVVEWQFHQARLTITTLAGAYWPVWHLPFPAVTVCEINKVPLSRARSFLRDARMPPNMTQEQALKEMQRLVELIEHVRFEEDHSRLQELLEANGLVGEALPRFMRNLTTPCEELLVECRWKGAPLACADVFTIRRTYEGYCCSFNYLAINTDLVKHDVNLVDQPPLRVSSAGQETGLSVLVYTPRAEYHSSAMASFGVKVLLHDPYDYPSMSVMKKMSGVGSETFLAMVPWVTGAAHSVRQVPFQRRSWRGCLFPDERSLALMKRYSYDNCVMECRRNVSARLCGCTPFYFPSDGAHRVCEARDARCLADNRHLFETMYPGVERSIEQLLKEPFSYPCQCLPDCENNYYPVEDYGSDLAKLHSNSHTVFDETLDIENHTVFHVFFGNFMATRYRRTILYSWYSQLGSFGGLLSLFIGFSLVSGFEFIYYFTIRFVFEYRSASKIKSEELGKHQLSIEGIQSTFKQKNKNASINRNVIHIKRSYADRTVLF